jgi:hypothetical protein
MIHRTHLLATALSVALLAPLSSRAADVAISGTLVPGSCALTLAGNGEVDWGTIDFASLADVVDTAMTPKNVDASIACSTPTKFAIAAHDNRGTTLHAPSDYNFGLGRTVGGRAIGYFRMTTDAGFADGAESFLLQSGNLIDWSVAIVDFYWEHSGSTGTSQWRAFGGGTYEPAAVTDASLKISVEPTIHGRSALQLTEQATLDGSATLELTYL